MSKPANVVTDLLPEEPNVDPEIDRLKDAYDAFRGLDRDAQNRCLRWLNERIATDQKNDREAGL